jgi:hypothetical protein
MSYKNEHRGAETQIIIQGEKTPYRCACVFILRYFQNKLKIHHN